MSIGNCGLGYNYQGEDALANGSVEGSRFQHLRHLFGLTFRNDLSASCAAFWTSVNDPV